MKKTTNRIVNRIPGFYTRNDRSVLISIIDSIAPEIDHLYELAQQVANMVSINKVHDGDIYERFGSMFNLYKYSYEDYETYRARVRATVAEKYGGVPQIIKNTVAGYAGITNTNDIENGIQVIGAWDYGGSIPDEAKRPGYFLVMIDENLATKHVTPKMLKEVVNSVKAAGVRVYLAITFEKSYEYCVLDIGERFWESIKYIATDEAIFNIGIDFSNVSILNDEDYFTNYTLITNVFKLNIKSIVEKFIDIVKYREYIDNPTLIADDIIDGVCTYINNIYNLQSAFAGYDIGYDDTADNQDDNITPLITDDIPLTSIKQVDNSRLSVGDDVISAIIQKDDGAIAGSDTSWSIAKYNSSDKYAIRATDRYPPQYIVANTENDGSTISGDDAYNNDISIYPDYGSIGGNETTWSKHKYNSDDTIITDGEEELIDNPLMGDNTGGEVSATDAYTANIQDNKLDLDIVNATDDESVMGINGSTTDTGAVNVGDDKLDKVSMGLVKHVAQIGGHDGLLKAGTNNGECRLNGRFTTNSSTISGNYDIIKQI